MIETRCDHCRGRKSVIGKETKLDCGLEVYRDSCPTCDVGWIDLQRDAFMAYWNFKPFFGKQTRGNA